MDSRSAALRALAGMTVSLPLPAGADPLHGGGSGFIDDEVLACEGVVGEGGVWRERSFGLFTV